MVRGLSFEQGGARREDAGLRDQLARAIFSFAEGQHADRDQSDTGGLPLSGLSFETGLRIEQADPRLTDQIVECFAIVVIQIGSGCELFGVSGGDSQFPVEVGEVLGRPTRRELSRNGFVL